MTRARPAARTDPDAGVWVWDRPPPAPPLARTPPKLNHRRVAAKLRAHPGEWLRLVDDGPPLWAKEISGGRLAAYRPIGFYEAVTLEWQRGHYGTWVRYIGDRDA